MRRPPGALASSPTASSDPVAVGISKSAQLARHIHVASLARNTLRQSCATPKAPACARAMSIRSPTYQSVNSILTTGMDRRPLPAKPTQTSLPLHENVRGPDYYH